MSHELFVVMGLHDNRLNESFRLACLAWHTHVNVLEHMHENHDTTIGMKDATKQIDFFGRLGDKPPLHTGTCLPRKEWHKALWCILNLVHASAQSGLGSISHRVIIVWSRGFWSQFHEYEDTSSCLSHVIPPSLMLVGGYEASLPQGSNRKTKYKWARRGTTWILANQTRFKFLISHPNVEGMGQGMREIWLDLAWSADLSSTCRLLIRHRCTDSIATGLVSQKNPFDGSF